MTSDWVTTGLSAIVRLSAIVFLIALVISIAFVVHGIASFGFAQVSMGIIPLFRSPASTSTVFTAAAW